MNGTKKTLTTLSAAAALALGGFAVAQTGTSTDTQAGTQMGSSSTLQNDSATMSSDNSTLNNDTSTLGAGSSTLGSDSSNLNQSSDIDNQPVARMDRG